MFENLLTCLLYAVGIGAGVAIIFALLRGMMIVKEGTVLVTEADGRFSRILNPGRHFLLPVMEEVGKEVKLHLVHFESPVLELSTRNLATLKFALTMNYQIARDANSPYLTADRAAVYRAVYTVEDWQRATQEEAVAVATEVLSTQEFRSVVDSDNWIRDLSEQIRDELNQRTFRWGVYVDSLGLIGVEFSDKNRNAINPGADMERMKRESRARAEAQAEAANIMNLSPEQLLQLHYINQMGEAIKNNPQAQIVLSPESLGMPRTGPSGQMKALAQEAGVTQMLPAGNQNPPQPPAGEDRPESVRTHRVRDGGH